MHLNCYLTILSLFMRPKFLNEPNGKPLRMDSAMFDRWKARLYRQSVKFVAPLEHSARSLLLIWTLIVALLCLLRVLSPITPANSAYSILMLLAPHMLILSSPFFAYWAANALFPRGTDFAQPDIRLARVGRWEALDALSVRDHSSFGAVGIMASLLLGLLLNVPVRTAEFMAAVPAMTGAAPLWGQMIYVAMSTDLVLMNFLYTLCFFMALRHVPFFPRVLVLTWSIDILSQCAIANYVAGAPHLPATVATSIAPLLEGNLKKAFISVVIWMPYLLLSERVNVTYRWRQPAG